MSEPTDDRETHWSVDKKIPLALIFVMLVQTGSFVWWVSATTTRLDVVERQLITISPNADRLTRVEVKIENVERGVTRIESLMQSRTPTGLIPTPPR